MERAARHGLRPEPVALAEHDAGERHRQRRPDDEHAADVAHERRLLRLGPHHEAGRVAQRQHRQPERLAQLQEAGRLVRAVGVDRPRQVHRVVGDDPDRPSLHPGQRGHHAGREGRTQLEHRPLVGHQLEGPPHVVDPAPIRGHDVPEQLLVRCAPLAHVPLEVRQIAAGRLDGLLLVGAEDVDDPVRHLHRDRADVLGGEHAQPAALDHGGPTHPDVGVGSGDDDVAASEQRGVAGEAAPRHDADQRHEPAQRAEPGEGLGVEPGDHGHVGVAGPAAAALGEEDHGQPQAFDELEEPVLLLVVHLALGAGQHGIVVRQHGTARPFSVEEVTVDPTDAGDEAVGGRVGDEVLGAAARPLGRDDEPAVLLEAAGVAQVLDVLPRRPPADARAGARWPPAVRRRGSPRRGRAARRARAVSRAVAGAGRGGGRPSATGSSDSCIANRARHRSARHRPPRTSTESTRPGVAASTTCSIFMDSSTTRTVPGATWSPGSDRRPAATVPAKGTVSSVSPATGVRAPRSRRGRPRRCGTTRRAPGAATRCPRCRSGSRSSPCPRGSSPRRSGTPRISKVSAGWKNCSSAVRQLPTPSARAASMALQTAG